MVSHILARFRRLRQAPWLSCWICFYLVGLVVSVILTTPERSWLVPSWTVLVLIAGLVCEELRHNRHGPR
jgi:hypothetical protein